MAINASPQPGDPILLFDGHATHVEVPNHAAYSVSRNHALTVSAWIRADIDDFPVSPEGYVHWMGKGRQSGDQGDREWACRMYNQSFPDRPQRTSFYLFNPRGGLGVGSYVPGPVGIGTEWRLIVGVADDRRTILYRNGERTDCDSYRGVGDAACPVMLDNSGTQVVIYPEAGNSPLRIGTEDMKSFFLGSIARVRIWGRVLCGDEIRAMYESDAATPRDDLVAEFLLDEGSGIVANDSSGSANNGAIAGGAWGTA